MLEKFMRAKEDRPTPPEVYNMRLYLTVMAISMSLLVFGYDTSFIGTTLEIPSFTRDFGLDQMSSGEKSDTTGNLTSVFSVGAFFGSLFMFFIFELFGRRVSLLIADGLSILGAVLCTAANGNLDVGFVKAQLDIERALTSEGEKHSLWQYLGAAFKEARMKGIRNRFGLVVMMTIFQAWGGAVAINYYSPTIFRSIGLENTTLWTGVYGVIKSVSAIIYFIFFIEAAGRKWPWIISCIGCGICMYFLGAYIHIVNPESGTPQSASQEAAGKAAAAAIMIYGFVWSFGANGLPLIIASEIFTPSLRSVSGPFAGMSVWLWSFVVTKVEPYMFDNMGTGGFGVYFFFGTMLFCSTVYAYFFIHETKGLRTDQMDALFGAVNGQVVDYEEEAMQEKGGGVEMVETVV
ncbi:general substrate transporter [Aspergillus sclerotiicarbonarius CBS 121057]|uniref:General substrate transporter n=1 Tax=Aspergillus sclerotiicarbonarius (strain CBS 121057 / IBT 28362) TaxID=1448318 RepID=A0A319DT40_ASPSB|nr:general substrate transporter [Aspergillus sclerotiicarbonarius CBS 121057]